MSAVKSAAAVRQPAGLFGDQSGHQSGHRQANKAFKVNNRIVLIPEQPENRKLADEYMMSASGSTAIQQQPSGPASSPDNLWKRD